MSKKSNPKKFLDLEAEEEEELTEDEHCLSSKDFEFFDELDQVA